MDGDGGSVTEEYHEPVSFEVPALLARLESDAVEERRQAVRTIRAHVDDRPNACLATVPKLRSLLTDSSLDCHQEIATCLAELAAYSPTDVAPSTDAIVAFVGDEPTHAATPPLVRALESIATERPDALVGHVEDLACALECEEPAARATAADVFVRLGSDTDATLEDEAERLRALLDDDHAHVRANASLALGHAGIEDARDRLEELATDDPDPAVRERASRAVERLS